MDTASESEAALLFHQRRIEKLIADARERAVLLEAENAMLTRQGAILRAHIAEQNEARDAELLDRQLDLIEARSEVVRLKAASGHRVLARVVAAIRAQFSRK